MLIASMLGLAKWICLTVMRAEAALGVLRLGDFEGLQAISCQTKSFARNRPSADVVTVKMAARHPTPDIRRSAKRCSV
jgi:hypothetical protein